jgi:flagellar hook-associated protein 1 FlgK
VSASVTGNGIYQVQISSGGNAVTFSNITGNALSSLGLSSLPTGHLGAATTTYGGFASNLISDVASRAAAAQTDSTAKTTTLTALQTTFSNQSGVNVDQQTALLTQLQNLYAASARVITTQTAMFQSLLQAVGG